MIDSVQESALVAVLEQVMHHHLTQAQRGLLPANISPYKLKHVLDINCRIGAWAIDLALSYPGIYVTALDGDATFIELARRSAEIGAVNRTRFYESHPLKPLPLADASFDFVHSLQLSPVFRPHEWPFFLSECKRVMKPGAVISLVSLSIGPTSSDAYQRLLSLFDALLQKRGYSFSEHPGMSTPGVHLFRLLKEAGFVNVSYTMHPVNFGGPSNPGGRACCQLLAGIAKKQKLLLLEHHMTTDEAFDALLLEKQHDIGEAQYCATGALITATAYAP
jgi:SAM-dependent methyltransferase